jgi:hypothetical protein
MTKHISVSDGTNPALLEPSDWNGVAVAIDTTIPATYVPYTGANADVNLGTHSVTTPKVNPNSNAAVGLEAFGNTTAQPTLRIWGKATDNGNVMYHGDIGVDTYGRLLFGGTCYATAFGNALGAPTLVIDNNSALTMSAGNTNYWSHNCAIIIAGSSTTGKNCLHYIDQGDYYNDMGTAAQTNPTLYIHSASSGITNYISIYHDGTNGNINTGAGQLKTTAVVNSAGFNVGANVGIDATVALAKLTTGGSNGSMTFHKGILTAYSAPT